MIYKLFEDENLRVIVKHTVVVDDSPPSNGVVWNDVANSLFHKIVAHPKILPYTYMVRWVVDQLEITDRTFITSRKTTIGSFKLRI